MSRRSGTMVEGWVGLTIERGRADLHQVPRQLGFRRCWMPCQRMIAMHTSKVAGRGQCGAEEGKREWG
jgi:hypothetical protein